MCTDEAQGFAAATMMIEVCNIVATQSVGPGLTWSTIVNALAAQNQGDTPKEVFICETVQSMLVDGPNEPKKIAVEAAQKKAEMDCKKTGLVEDHWMDWKSPVMTKRDRALANVHLLQSKS